MSRFKGIAQQSKWSILLAALLLNAGCDPGYRYQPRGWNSESNGQWSRTIAEGLTVTTGDIIGLIGESGIIPEFEFVNRTDRVLVLESAELAVDGAVLVGDLPGRGALEFRTVRPEERKRIVLLWSFPRPSLEMMGRQPALILRFRLGEDQKTVEIVYDGVEP